MPSTELIDSLVSSPGSFVGKYVNHVWEGVIKRMINTMGKSYSSKSILVLALLSLLVIGDY